MVDMRCCLMGAVVTLDGVAPLEDVASCLGGNYTLMGESVFFLYDFSVSVANPMHTIAPLGSSVCFLSFCC